MKTLLGRRTKQLASTCSSSTSLFFQNKKIEKSFVEIIRRLCCIIKGHNLVKDIWLDKTTGNYEIYKGCTKCDLLVIEKFRH